jgi:hypothetical protein
MRDRFMIHLKASFAEEEARKISIRTKAALQAAKARGTKLGGYHGAPAPDAEVGAASLATRREISANNAADYADTIAEFERPALPPPTASPQSSTAAASPHRVAGAGRPCRCSGCSPGWHSHVVVGWVSFSALLHPLSSLWSCRATNPKAVRRPPPTAADFGAGRTGEPLAAVTSLTASIWC